MHRFFYLFISTVFLTVVSTVSIPGNEANLPVANGTSLMKILKPPLPHPPPPLQTEELCSNSETDLKISRDPNDCDKYYISCLVTTGTEIPTTDVTSAAVIKNITLMPYNTQSRRCNENFLFDQIELKCLPSEQVDCNPFNCPESSTHDLQLFPDAKRPAIFIQCQQGIAERRECQPYGTIFEEESQTCIKPASIPEQFSISVLRTLIRFMEGTRDTMSPWIEIALINSTDSSILSSLNISTSTDEIYGETIEEPPKLMNQTYVYEEEDEMKVFTQDTKYIVLYYLVIVGVAISIIISFLCVSTILAKIFVKTKEKDDVQHNEEFYRYNQHDKYLMTRM